MSPADEQRLAGVIAEAVKQALVGATGLSAKQASDIALAAAKEATTEAHAKMFAQLGVNVADAKEMQKFAADIEFLRSMHDGAGAVGRRAAMFVLTAFLGGALLALWAGLKLLLAVNGQR